MAKKKAESKKAADKTPSSAKGQALNKDLKSNVKKVVEIEEAQKLNRTSGQVTWDDVAFGTTNPATVTVKSTVSGQPERIYVRAILLDKNAPVGIPSDPTYVTVNP